jgi:hypothetical protein
MEEYISTEDLPDEWHDRLKDETSHLLDTMSLMPVALALTILQSVAFHLLYFRFAPGDREKILERWPTAGKMTFDLWAQEDSQENT